MCRSSHQHLIPATQFSQGLGTAEGVLIEILCTRTNKEIDAIKQEYKRSEHDSQHELPALSNILTLLSAVGQHELTHFSSSILQNLVVTLKRMSLQTPLVTSKDSLSPCSQ